MATQSGATGHDGASTEALRDTPNALRIDGPHENHPNCGTVTPGEANDPSQAADAPVDQVAVGQTGNDPGTLVALRLERHAEQLAEHLRERQATLDRREAHLHAEVARWEAELRAARLSLQQEQQRLHDWQKQLEQESERLRQTAAAVTAAEVALERQAEQQLQQLQQREESLAQQQLQLQQRERDLSEREALCEASFQRLRLREQELEARRCFHEQQLTQRAAELQKLHQRLLHQWTTHLAAHNSSQRQTPEPVEEAARRAWADVQSVLQERLQKLAELESQLMQRHETLRQQQEALALAQRQFDAARQQWRDQQAATQQRWHETCQRWKQHWRQQRERLDRRATQLRQALRSAHAAWHDAVRLHGESLELRWAAELTWHALCNRVPTKAVAQRAAAIRAQVAQYFTQRSQELHAVREKLRQQAEHLRTLHNELQKNKALWRAWLDRQYRQLEAEAARLIAYSSAISSSNSHAKTDTVTGPLPLAPCSDTILKELATNPPHVHQPQSTGARDVDVDMPSDVPIASSPA